MATSTEDVDLTVFRYTGERILSSKKTPVQIYDFRNPVFLTEIELRQVRIRHEKFIHYLSARLSMYLGMDFGLKMSKLYTAPYLKFIESIPNPTYINLFKVEQMTGVGIIDTNPRLAMTIVNRMLGGQGHSIHEERYLTEIEMGLMDEIINIVLDEWTRQWEEVTEMDIAIVGNENNGRFLQTAPHDAIMLVVDMESTLGDCSAQMQLAVPYYMIEPIIREMQANSRKYSRVGTIERTASWLTGYDAIYVPIFAEWDAFSASVQDVLGLREGDIIQLPKNILKSTKLRCHNAIHFLGEVGVEQGKVAVKITEKVV
ncbi:MAG: flagellar motor switch protein FliM [Verrucomicrobia bacterium GWF2_51_19]|nr:MAG: flagellar motor switch protein FliM [Verrucomicrobia bacterium GWF2_51_19]HCJ12060.1 flagellar motor switch protein FliM [Opitutae bacterium]